MATLTIRNLEPEVKQALRERAARHGVSMEEEARRLLRELTIMEARADNLHAGDLIAMIRAAPKGKPLDERFARLSQKEIADLVSGASFDCRRHFRADGHFV